MEIRVGELLIAKPMLLWINDGLMAVFFLLVGLEVKRELLEGELSSPAKALLPAVGRFRPRPDIAFALRVLALLGSRVPVALKIFFTAVAIFDDLGAIAIIAAFYTKHLPMESLTGAAIATAALAVLNMAGMTRRAPYILVGVVLALAIPLRATDREGHSPLHRLESIVHPWVAFRIMPLFAFDKTGVSLGGITPAALLDPVPRGSSAGLIVGKQVGVFGFVRAAVKTGIAKGNQSASTGTPGSSFAVRMASADLTWLTFGAVVSFVVRNF
jgi:NhaA family Na+:H+ antiporter